MLGIIDERARGIYWTDDHCIKESLKVSNIFKIAACMEYLQYLNY